MSRAQRLGTKAVGLRGARLGAWTMSSLVYNVAGVPWCWGAVESTASECRQGAGRNSRLSLGFTMEEREERGREAERI